MLCIQQLMTHALLTITAGSVIFNPSQKFWINLALTLLEICGQNKKVAI